MASTGSLHHSKEDRWRRHAMKTNLAFVVLLVFQGITPTSAHVFDSLIVIPHSLNNCLGLCILIYASFMCVLVHLAAVNHKKIGTLMALFDKVESETDSLALFRSRCEKRSLNFRVQLESISERLHELENRNSMLSSEIDRERRVLRTQLQTQIRFLKRKLNEVTEDRDRAYEDLRQLRSGAVSPSDSPELRTSTVAEGTTAEQPNAVDDLDFDFFDLSSEACRQTT